MGVECIRGYGGGEEEEEEYRTKEKDSIHSLQLVNNGNPIPLSSGAVIQENKEGFLLVILLI